MSSIAQRGKDDPRASTESSTTIACGQFLPQYGSSHIVATIVMALLAGVVLFTTLTQLMVCAALFRISGFTSHPQYGWVYVSNTFSIMPHLAVMWAFAVVPVLGVLYVVSHCNANASINACAMPNLQAWGVSRTGSTFVVSQATSQTISALVVFLTQVGLFLVIFCDATQHGTAHTVGVCLFLAGVLCLHLRVAAIDDTLGSVQTSLSTDQAPTLHKLHLCVPGCGLVDVCAIDKLLFPLVLALVVVFSVSFFVTNSAPENLTAHGISCISEYLLLVIFIFLNALATLRCVRVVYCWHIV